MKAIKFLLSLPLCFALSACPYQACDTPPAPTTRPFAGGDFASGSSDGTGTAASFNSPQGIAVDAKDNVFIADTGNNTIRKITSAGSVTTFAGTAGIIGSADGAAAAASFNSPQGVAADAMGNIFVADTGNNIIRKITPAGDVTTIAGTAGVTGSADGTAAAASFNSPQGVAFDELGGNVFVADTGNNIIRKITPAGEVTTIAGTAGITGSADGTAAAASFNSPQGVAVDITGDVYVADTGNNTIRKITPAGEVTTFAGTAGVNSNGTAGTQASFNSPQGILVYSSGRGDLFVADTGNGLIRRVTQGGYPSTVVSAQNVKGMAFDNYHSKLYLTVPFGVVTWSQPQCRN